MTRLFSALVAATAAALGWRRASRRTQQQRSQTAVPPRRYDCVEVCAGPHACAAAQSVWSVRILADDAPELPLAGCTEARCTCTLLHYADRRHVPRVGPHVPYAGAERRKSAVPAPLRAVH